MTTFADFSRFFRRCCREVVFETLANFLPMPTFSTLRYTSIRTIIAIALAMGWKLHQMDVTTAFLNGIIEEEVYIKQPEGFIVHEKDSHICKLKKALYELKQAPRAWHG